MSNLPAVSIVIPTLNGGALFEKVLARLQGQSYSGSLELVVIDSGSTDGTIEVARSAGARTESIAARKFNHGGTRNRGIQLSRGDIVVLLTQDAEPADEHLVARLVAPFSDSSIAGVYARQIPRPEHDVLIRRNVSQHTAGGCEAYVRRLAGPDALTAMKPLERYVFCNFDNVCASIRRSAWLTVPFRRVTFAEDLDWAKRVLEAGWSIAYEPAASVIHSHDRSMAYEYRRTYFCNRALYAHFSLERVTGLQQVLHTLWANILQDGAYVWTHEKRLGGMLRLLSRVPFRSASSLIAQYHGARDERLQRAAPFEPV